MKGDLTAEEQTAAVKEALVEEDRRRNERMRAAEQAADKLREEAEGHLAARRGMQADLAAAKEQAAQAARQRDEERDARSELHARLGALEEQLSAREEEEVAAKSVRRFAKYCIRQAVLLGFASASVTFGVRYLVRPVPRLTTIALFALAGLVWACIIDRAGQRNLIVKDWRPFRTFHRFRLWLFVAVLTPGAVNLITNYLSRLFDSGR